MIPEVEDSVASKWEVPCKQHQRERLQQSRILDANHETTTQSLRGSAAACPSPLTGDGTSVLSQAIGLKWTHPRLTQSPILYHAYLSCWSMSEEGLLLYSTFRTTCL